MRSESGFSIIENLVAISLLGIAMVGTTVLFASTFQSSSSSRDYVAVSADVQSVVDSYYNDYNSLLAEFASAPGEIANGESAVRNLNSTNAKADYVITLTAIKTKSEGTPEAVRIEVRAAQRRGKLENSNFTFETVIPQVRQ